MRNPGKAMNGWHFTCKAGEKRGILVVDFRNAPRTLHHRKFAFPEGLQFAKNGASLSRICLSRAFFILFSVA